MNFYVPWKKQSWPSWGNMSRFNLFVPRLNLSIHQISFSPFLCINQDQRSGNLQKENLKKKYEMFWSNFFYIQENINEVRMKNSYIFSYYLFLNFLMELLKDILGPINTNKDNFRDIKTIWWTWSSLLSL